MAHELEIAADGRVGFVAGGNLDAWHRLGTVLPGGLSADQVLDEAFLRGWDVRLQEILTRLTQVTEDGVTEDIVAVKDQFAVVRTNPFTKLAEVLGDPGGVVGRKYNPFQNESAIDFLAAVTDEYSDAEFETAGTMRGGTQVFITMRLKNFLIGGVDAHNMYLVYIVNHVTGANIAFTTHIRVVCANTADAALAGAKMTFRHTASIEQRHQEAREALRMSWNYNALFEAEAEKMLAEKMDLDEFRKVCDEIWARPEDEASPTQVKTWEERRGQLKQLFVFAETQEDIRFTRWGAFNAIVEYADHVAPSGGKTAAQKAEARALRTIDGGPTVSGTKINIKERAFALLKA